MLMFLALALACSLARSLSYARTEAFTLLHHIVHLWMVHQYLPIAWLCRLEFGGHLIPPWGGLTFRKLFF